MFGNVLLVIFVNYISFQKHWRKRSAFNKGHCFFDGEDELASEKQLNQIQKLEKHELRQELEYHLEIIQAKDEEIAQISQTATSLMSQLKKSNFALEKSKALQRQLLLGRLEMYLFPQSFFSISRVLLTLRGGKHGFQPFWDFF